MRAEGVVEIVVRSVVRRSRLKELGVGGATFSAAGSELPAPVGTTVSVPSDKKIKASVTIENTGSGAVTISFVVWVFYADTLSDSTGDPATDYANWSSERDAYDYDYGEISLNPGDTHTFTGFSGVDAGSWSEGTIIDAGVVLTKMEEGVITAYFDSLKITDAVEIIAPTLRVKISDVSFSEA